MATHSGYYFYDSKEQHASETIIKDKFPVRLKFMFLFVSSKLNYQLQAALVIDIAEA